MMLSLRSFRCLRRSSPCAFRAAVARCDYLSTTTTTSPLDDKSPRNDALAASDEDDPAADAAFDVFDGDYSPPGAQGALNRQMMRRGKYLPKQMKKYYAATRASLGVSPRIFVDDAVELATPFYVLRKAKQGGRSILVPSLANEGYRGYLGREWLRKAARKGAGSQGASGPKPKVVGRPPAKSSSRTRKWMVGNGNPSVDSPIHSDAYSKYSLSRSLAKEVYLASQEKGEAIRYRNDTHRQAIENEANTHLGRLR